MTFQWIFSSKYHRDTFANIAGRSVKKVKRSRLSTFAFAATVTFKPKQGWKLQWLAERARLLNKQDWME